MPATLSSKGRVTIPKAIRDELGVEVGDRISFLMREDGIVELRPQTVDLRTLYGLLKRGTAGARPRRRGA